MTNASWGGATESEADRTFKVARLASGSRQRGFLVPCERVLSLWRQPMLRIEGNKSGRWIARIAVAAAMARLLLRFMFAPFSKDAFPSKGLEELTENVMVRSGGMRPCHMMFS